MYKKSAMHVQRCCFAQQTYWVFDVLVAVAVVIATFPRRKLTGPGLLLVCKVANPTIWIMSCTMLDVNREIHVYAKRQT